LVDKLRTLDWGSIGKMIGEMEIVLVYKEKSGYWH
jgi:hypothetical protein